MFRLPTAGTFSSRLPASSPPPKRWTPVTAVRSLALRRAPPCPTAAPIATKNRFSDLLVDEVDCGEDEPAADVAAATATSCVDSKKHVKKSREAHVGSVVAEKENELLRVEAKLYGRAATVLIDCGSTHDFISEVFVRRHKVPTELGSELLKVTLADGKRSSHAMETTNAIDVVVSDFKEKQQFTVFPLARYDAILGKPWLTRNNPRINFRTNEIIVDGNGLPSAPSQDKDGDSQIENMFISGCQASHALRNGEQGFLAWVTAEDDSGLDPPLSIPNPNKPEVADLLREYSDVFPDELPDALPPERSVDHEIRLEEGAPPPSRPAYRLPKPEMDELKSQLEQLLAKGFVEPSKSPYCAPVFFVKKGRWQFAHGMRLEPGILTKLL